jgi:hypothetical protein
MPLLGGIFFWNEFSKKSKNVYSSAQIAHLKIMTGPGNRLKRLFGL